MWLTATFPLRAVATPLARAERAGRFQKRKPAPALVGRQRTAVGVGEFDEPHHAARGQHAERVAEELSVTLDPHRERDVEKVIAKVRRQLFGLHQQRWRRLLGGSGKSRAGRPRSHS
ncbi:hypothetical protein [Burkholderia contaminans]|uniref:hypothetical protein n=1 Tax=Burkholderia contaminans TaxID=488447 RepID=UPI001583D8F6|nr:hypothetical protein [Burkholderia contaminans]